MVDVGGGAQSPTRTSAKRREALEEASAAGRVLADDFVAAGSAPPSACLQSADQVTASRRRGRRRAGRGGGPAAGRCHLLDRTRPGARGWAALAVDARSWAGPPGAGVLVVRGGVAGRLEPSPPPVPLIVAAAMALESVSLAREAESARLSELIERIRREVPRLVPDIEVVGDPVDDCRTW